jgi:hypothetical protein
VLKGHSQARADAVFGGLGVQAWRIDFSFRQAPTILVNRVDEYVYCMRWLAQVLEKEKGYRSMHARERLAGVKSTCGHVSKYLNMGVYLKFYAFASKQTYLILQHLNLICHVFPQHLKYWRQH